LRVERYYKPAPVGGAKDAFLKNTQSHFILKTEHLPRQARDRHRESTQNKKASCAGGSEIWTAVTGPAGSADSANDSRANSLAQLGPQSDAEAVAGATARGRALWWWSVLATGVDGGLPSGAPLQVRELWPPPAAGMQLLVSTVHGTTAAGGNTPHAGEPCVNGSAASSCVTLWNESQPLTVATTGAVRETFPFCAIL